MDKETQHTPGPWSLGKSYDQNIHGDFEVFGGEFGHYATGRVAVVDRRAGNSTFVESCNPQTQRLTAEANARLIAAAPELLAALKAIVGHWEDLDAPEWGHDLCSDAFDAIAKAEGGTN